MPYPTKKLMIACTALLSISSVAMPSAMRGQQLDEDALFGLRSQATAYNDDWIYVENIDPFDDANRSWVATISLQEPFNQDAPASIRFQCVTDGKVSAITALLSWDGYFQGDGEHMIDVRYRFDSAEPSLWHSWILLPSSQNVARIPDDRAGYFIDRVNGSQQVALRIRDPADGETNTFVFSSDGAREMYRHLKC